MCIRDRDGHLHFHTALGSVPNRIHLLQCCFTSKETVPTISVIVKRPVLPPSVVDGRSRNPLYYYYYYARALHVYLSGVYGGSQEYVIFVVLIFTA